MNPDKPQLREQLRAMRRAIPAAQRAQAAHSMFNNVTNLPCYKNAKNIALYWPNDDEIDPLPLLHFALGENKCCYLPVLLIDPRQRLAFARYTLDTPMLPNRYGILEPEVSFQSLINLNELDIIFVPIVGFDKNGYRLGRGGGFYDTTFAELPAVTHHKWPKLIGLSYSCQEVIDLPLDSWDWRLDAIVTEDSVLEFCL